MAEAAVVGANDATTGQAIIAYVTLRGGSEVDVDDLRNHVAKEIGAIAKPKTIYFTPDLPKTRSGKIMRRLLRDVAEGRNLGDTTTLADASVVGELQRRASEAVSRGLTSDQTPAPRPRTRSSRLDRVPIQALWRRRKWMVSQGHWRWIQATRPIRCRSSHC